MRIFLVLFTLMAAPLFSLEHLPQEYQVSFGSPQASIQIIEYFSFNCPHCISLFREDFSRIKQEFIDSGKIHWIFHPVPIDLPTVQALECFTHLSESQKQLFLEVILEEADSEEPEITSLLMKKAMEVLKHPLTNLDEKETLTNSKSFQDAFDFVKQENSIEAVPSLVIQGTYYPESVPEYSFILKHVLKEGAR